MASSINHNHEIPYESPHETWTAENSYGKVESEIKEGRLWMRITTENTYMEPMNRDPDLFEALTQLDADPFKKKYIDIFKERCADYSDGWILNNDPLNAFFVFSRRSDEIIGHAGLIHPFPDESGAVQMICNVRDEKTERNIEVSLALVNLFAPALIQNGYEVMGQPITRIVSYANGESKIVDMINRRKEYYEALHMRLESLSDDPDVPSDPAVEYYGNSVQTYSIIPPKTIDHSQKFDET